MLIFEGETDVELSISTFSAGVDLASNGLYVYLFCEDPIDSFMSLLNTAITFFGAMGYHGEISMFRGILPDYQVKANVEMLKWTNNIDLKLASQSEEDFVLDEKYIKSGDLILIYRLDGLDPMIMYATGS